MKYENVYFRDGENSVCVFGRFNTKSEAIKLAKRTAFNLPFLSEFSKMAVLNRDTGEYVYTMASK